MSETLLAVQDIHTYYGDSYVLQGLSLELGAGKIVAILGRNGMGKTTLIRSVAGLTPPRQGDIRFKGASLRGRPPYAIAQEGIALVPQGRRIFRSLSVRENLLLPTSRLARPRKGRWNLDTVLAQFPQLAERIEHPGGALSGGEQQMLAVGRALMANPDLVLMDEPSEGLAPKLVQQVDELMKSLREKYGLKGIAMTGYGMEDDLRKGAEAGFSEYLVKPVNVTMLEQAIRRVVSGVRVETVGL